MTQVKNRVDNLYDHLSQVSDFLKKEPSLCIFMNGFSRKSLIIAAASFFEEQLTSCVEKFASQALSEHHIIVNFIKNKAIKRQYHTWFDWRANNANSFFGLFGEDFKSYMNEQQNTDDKLKESIQAFMEIGQIRNEIIHEDITKDTYFEKTTEEVYRTYRTAMTFVTQLPCILEEFEENTQ